MKITKRDVLFFIIGFLTFFIVELIFNWEANKESFREGFKGARSSKIDIKAE